MATEKCTIEVSVVTRWFFRPLMAAGIIYVILGGDADKAAKFVAKHGVKIKVPK